MILIVSSKRLKLRQVRVIKGLNYLYVRPMVSLVLIVGDFLTAGALGAIDLSLNQCPWAARVVRLGRLLIPEF